MKIKKKNIPLVVLEAIEPLIDQSESENFLITTGEDSILKFEDSDEDSNFYFEILGSANKANKTEITIDFKPQSKSSTANHKVVIQHSQLGVQFKEWKLRLDAYSKLGKIFEDPILKRNEERFLTQFDILDEDADDSSFNLDQQLFLDEYLEVSKQKLAQLKERSDESTTKELEKLEIEADEIRKDLTKATKRRVIQKLARFWAKAQKAGIPVIKEIFINVMAELTKKLLVGN